MMLITIVYLVVEFVFFVMIANEIQIHHFSRRQEKKVPNISFTIFYYYYKHCAKEKHFDICIR